MYITSVKTPKVRVGMRLTELLDKAIPSLVEKSVVVVTSKIVSICQGDVVKNDSSIDKRNLIHKHSEYYLDDQCNAQYGIILTINNDTLIASGGIDESNGDGYLILWPKNIHEATKNIWLHLKNKFHLSHLGVIITDSHTTPLRWGTTGIGISWCGFEALKNYIDTPDIFGRKLHVTKASILDGLAAAAVVTMGEGNEQTPLAVVSDVPFVKFVERPPTTEETSSLRITKEEDIYAPLINSPKWKKGGGL
jgi:dihydrofolate synthase / folylpolyglutamate synthase